MRKLILSILCFAALGNNSAIANGGFSFGSSTGTTSDNSTTQWEGMVNEDSLSGPIRKRLTVGREVREMKYARIGSLIAQQINDWSFQRPILSDYMGYLGKQAKAYFGALQFDVETAVEEIYLRSPNKGPIGLNSSIGQGTSKGTNVGIVGVTNSTSSNDSSSVNISRTTCEDNLKWKGYQVNCQNGMGNGTKDGVTYEFINWKTTKAEGVQGPVRWNYQGGVVMIEHRAKGIIVSFQISDDIKVITADNLISFRTDVIPGNLESMSSHNITIKYVDAAWREFVAGSTIFGERRNSKLTPLWQLPTWSLSLMTEFVAQLGSDPEWTKRKLEAVSNLEDDQFAVLVKGSSELDLSLKFEMIPSGGFRPIVSQ